MKLDVKFKKKYAISLDEEKIKQVFSILEEYFSEPNGEATFSSIKALLKNEATIKFESMEELFKYDNSGEFRIVELWINYGTYDCCTVSFEYGFHWLFTYNSTIVTTIQIGDKDRFLEIRDKLERTFVKMRMPYRYILMSKISLSLLMNIILIAILIDISIKSGILNFITTSSNVNFFGYFLLLAFGVSLQFAFRSIWTRVYPPIQFLWGEEAKRMNNLARIRRNIFWVVFIGGTIVGIAVGVFVNLISKTL